MKIRLWCAAIVAALALAGCGGGGAGGDGVATLSGKSASNSPTSTTVKKTMAEAARDFAKCMRAHGINMPDPKVSGDGGSVQIQVGTGGGSQPNSQKLNAAQKACQHFMAAAGPNGGKRPDAAAQHKMQQQALAFARCMRAHGVDMPDPVFGADGSVRQAGPKVASKDDKAFRDATKACARPGKGPGFSVSGGGSGNGPSTHSGSDT
jgi:hypothetical protein